MAWGGAKPQATSGILRDNRTKQCWDVEKGACVERATCRGVTFEDHSQGRVTMQQASRGTGSLLSSPLSDLPVLPAEHNHRSEGWPEHPSRKDTEGRVGGCVRAGEDTRTQATCAASQLQLLCHTLAYSPCVYLCRSVFGKIALYSKK